MISPFEANIQQGSSYEFVGLSELQFLYLDRIYPSTIFRSYGTGRIDWIYCFLCFRLPAIALAQARRTGTKQRNGNPAFSGKEKPKKPIVLLPKNFLEEGFWVFAFLQERQKILRIL